MAAFEVIALDTATPQLRAPGASDTYTFPRAVEMPLGTANGVLYLNGSKVATSGSALTFDGTNFATTGTASATKLIPTGGSATGNGMYLPAANTLAWSNNGAETMRLDSSGNLGLGVTPSAWGSVWKAQQLQAGAFIASQTNANDIIHVGTNAFANTSNVWTYINTAAATRYQQYLGAHSWFTAPSGTAGNAISFTQALTLDVNRNLALNTTSVGTSAVGALSIGSGTEPSSGPADTVQLYSVDRSAGNTIPAFYCEGTGVTDAGITNTTVTHKIAMKINGTVYYLLATTNAT